MNFSLRQMRAFLMVAELKSFTRASEKIYLSQAALSLMIREFEEQIGFKVFERSTRMVKLNSAGDSIYPAIKKAVKDLEESIVKASIISNNQDNLVRLAATSTVSTSILPKVIAQIKEIYPHIEFDVHDVERDAINSLLDNDEIDVGLCLNSDVDRHFKKIKIGSCGIMAITRDDADHFMLNNSENFDFLEGKLVYCLPFDNHIQKIIDSLIAKSGVTPKKRSSFSNINTILAMIEANGGYALLPSFTKDACKRFKIKTCFIKSDVPDFDFVAMVKTNSPEKTSINVFIDVFGKYMGDHLN